MRSRFITDTSTATKARITPNDLRVLQVLNRYPYLPSTYIVALTGLNRLTLKDRFTILRHELKVITTPKASWAAMNARYRPAVYTLTERGVRELQSRGLYIKRAHALTNFAHDLMASLIVASFEIGAKQHGLELFDWEYLRNRDACKQQDHRLSVELNGDEHLVAPDWSPFIIKGDLAFAFYGVEADRNNEPIERENLDASSIARKFRYCREITRKGLYKRLGLPNCFHLFATVNSVHEASMRAALLKLTDGRGARDILFTRYDDFTSTESFPPATDWALTIPWRRAGYPDFNILEELHGPSEARPHPSANRSQAQH